jgi:formylglycine-generating enzyme required for sulfatase activity
MKCTSSGTPDPASASNNVFLPRRLKAALVLAPLILIGCGDDQPLPFLIDSETDKNPAEVAKAPLTTGSFTIVSGDRPPPPAKFRIVSQAVYPLIKQEENPTFDLIPIQGGEFTMGSSPDDPHHKPDELPAHRAHIDSFWMASTETTWALYQNFVKSDHHRNKDGTKDNDGDRLT